MEASLRILHTETWSRAIGDTFHQLIAMKESSRFSLDSSLKLIPCMASIKIVQELHVKIDLKLGI